jgi:hypothetical protein
MQETVLRGQGAEPAVDQLTGAPLTIEELLRRRGLVSYGGNIRLTPLDGVTGAANSSGGVAAPTTDSSVASVDPLAGSPSVVGASPVSAAGEALDIGSAGNAAAGGAATGDVVVTPEQSAAFEQLDNQTGGNGESYIDELIGLGLAGGALLLAYRAWKNRRGAAGVVPPADQTARMTTPLTPTSPGGAALDTPIIDGEFTEVRQPAQVTAEPQRALPAPRAALPAPNAGAIAADDPAAAARSATGAVSRALGDRYTGGRRDRAQRRVTRSTRVEPNDIGPIPLGRDVPEQTLREATAIADELIARRRPQGSHRGRAGAPTAPVNRYRPNEPIRNQREGLINEIINVLTTNPNAARQLRRGVR